MDLIRRIKSIMINVRPQHLYDVRVMNSVFSLQVLYLLSGSRAPREYMTGAI